MSVLKGNISSVLRRADNSLLNTLRQGMDDGNDLRAQQVADAKASLTGLGASADADTQLLLAQQDTKEGVQDVLANQLGMFANKGVAAQTASAREKLLADRETTALNNFKTELGNKDLLEGFQNKQQIKDELKELGQYQPGTPQYKEALEKHHQFNITNAVPDKQITDIYSQQFATADIQIRPETIQAAIGAGVDPTNPDSFTKSAHNTAVKTISDRLQGQWTGIQDKSVFDAKAKDLLSKSEWGQNFDRQIKLEAGQTTQDVRLKGLSSNIAAAIRSKNPDAVDNEVNATLDFLQANNITGDKAKVFDKNVELALDRSKIDPAAIFQNAEYGNTTYGTTQRISPTKASMLQADIKAAYREKYPNLPDRLLDPQVAKVISANQQLGFAIAEGKKDAAYKANLDADFRETGRAFKGQQHKALFAMAQDGTKTYIADRLIDKLSKLKFKSEDGFTATDATEVQRETSEVVERLRGFFTDDKGDFLAGASKQTLAAFRLAASKAIIGNAGIDEDSLPGDGNDLVFATVNRYRQMSDTSDYELLKLFVEALPDSQRSVEYDSDKKINVRKGINRFTQFAKGRMKDAHAVGLRPTKSGFTAFKTGINSLGLGADFDRLPPINSTKYQALMTPVDEQDVVNQDRTKRAAITALTQ